MQFCFSHISNCVASVRQQSESGRYCLGGAPVCVSALKSYSLILWQPLPIVLTREWHPRSSPTLYYPSCPQTHGLKSSCCLHFPRSLCYCTQRVYAIFKSTNMPQNFTVNLVLEAVLQGVPILFSHLAAVPMAMPSLQTSWVSGCYLPRHPPSRGGPLSAARLSIYCCFLT